MCKTQIVSILTKKPKSTVMKTNENFMINFSLPDLTAKRRQILFDKNPTVFIVKIILVKTPYTKEYVFKCRSLFATIKQWIHC